MLTYILALAVGIGSLAIYLAAFFFPEVHRKSDFIWSGVGLFLALVLWVCAGRITGGVLLGQLASVALLGWLGWQTLTLRRQLIPVEQQTPIPSTEKLQNQLSNFSLPTNVSQLPERLTNLFANANNRIQETLGAITKRKGSSATGVPQQQSAIDPPRPPSAAPQAEAAIVVTSVEVIPVAPSAAPQAEAAIAVTQLEVIPYVSEYTEKTPQQIEPDMPGSSVDTLRLEEIAPEVELAQPDSPPETGSSKTQDKPSKSAE